MRLISFLSLLILTCALTHAAEDNGGLQLALTASMVDNAATAHWVGGKTIDRSDWLDAGTKMHWPNPTLFFVATRDARLGHQGFTFGEESAPGPRHLRVGLTQAVGIGTLVTVGRISAVSVLAATAPYPGDPGDERQWVPAQHQRGSSLSTWLLPPETTTRAIRLTYQPTSSERVGILAALYVLKDRFQDRAAEAVFFSSSNSAMAARVVDGQYNCDSESTSWSNASRSEVISASKPEWIAMAWPQPLRLRGLSAFWALFGDVEVQTFTGPDTVHPKEAADSQWKKLITATCTHNYPAVANNELDFGTLITTRALRLRIISPAVEGGHGAMTGRTKGGTACRLDEILAWTPLGNAALQTEKVATTVEHPPIAIPFVLPSAGLVTLVIEDSTGKRIRNLIGETPFPAGKQMAYWDGLDESGSIPGPWGGIYKMVGQPVEPGTYTVRGLCRGPLDLRYEFTIANSAGTPPWLTGSHWGGGPGGWLADHSAPSAVLHLPGTPGRLLMTSPVAESNHGIIWTDLEGKKLDGKLWVGGNWTGATHLARDDGAAAKPGDYAYSGCVWEGGLRLVAFRNDGFPLVAPYTFADAKLASLGGLAVHDGVLLATAPKANLLIAIDTIAGAVLGTLPLSDGRGLACDAQGSLLALSGQRLLRYPAITRELVKSGKLPEPEVLVARGLEDPQGLTMDADGNSYVADWGASHQVKVFTAKGELIRSIGTAGGARVGPYDQTRMDHPHGLTVTPDGRLWVAELSHAPKRVSAWTRNGAFIKAFYGPAQYGGGGTLDSQDPKRFYYAENGTDTGLEFALDWKAGTSRLSNIYWLPSSKRNPFPNAAAPQTPIYIEGRQYMTDVNNTQPIGGPATLGIWHMRGGLAVQVAAFGHANVWDMAKGADFMSRRPAGSDPAAPTTFVWSDLDDDGLVQPGEVFFVAGHPGSLTINERLEICTASAEVFAPRGYTPKGAPIYDLSAGQKKLKDFFMSDVFSGSGQITAATDGWLVATAGMVRGIRDGRIGWTYPNEWPGQQAGVASTPPTRLGELMATTHHMGVIQPKDSDAGRILVIDGDKGNVFLMTTDGLFVATLFHDVRLTGEAWIFPEAKRNMPLNDITLYDEEFWSTATQTVDGTVYLVVGKSHSSLVRVDGLSSIKRLKPWTITVDRAQLESAQAYRLKAEAARLAKLGRDELLVRITAKPPVVDGKLDEWADDAWVTIDQRSERLGGNLDGALRISGDRLYAAYRTKDAQLVANGGDAWQFLFKTGGALDLMLATDSTADPQRSAPVAGDLRLLVTTMKGKPIAVLYQPVSPTRKQPGSFSSPWRTITYDVVADLSEQLQFGGADGGFEWSLPLASLGLSAKAGQTLHGDIGILRGNGFQTMQRTYWQNKATSTVADVPTEATLTPNLWGRIKLVAAP